MPRFFFPISFPFAPVFFFQFWQIILSRSQHQHGGFSAHVLLKIVMIWWKSSLPALPTPFTFGTNGWKSTGALPKLLIHSKLASEESHVNKAQYNTYSRPGEEHLLRSFSDLFASFNLQQLKVMIKLYDIHFHWPLSATHLVRIIYTEVEQIFTWRESGHFHSFAWF